MRRDLFFVKVRPMFGGALNQSQVEGINAILDYAERNLVPLHHLAYALATTKHETADTMQPVRETLLSSDDKAIAALDKALNAGRLGQVNNPYWRKDASGKSWLGRGLVQLTHRRNYETMRGVTGIDLVARPELAMQMDTALTIMFVGMQRGSFTGKKFDDYISANGVRKDYLGARKIINGTDRALTVKTYAEVFEAALKAGEYAVAAQPIATPAPDPAPAVEPARPLSGWAAVFAAIAKFFGGKS